MPYSIGEALHWIVRVLVQFFAVSRATTWLAIACLLAARVTRMLAFLLPLKVILLAGSEGVPRYFQFLFSPESKDIGIVILSAGAVAAYSLTVLLQASSKRLAERGGGDLLAASGVMSVVAGQREQMQGFYARFAGLGAAMLFALAALVVLAALNWALALFVLAVLCAFHLLTAWALRGVTALNRTRLSDFITENLGGYLGVLSAVGFLSSFLIILYPFIRSMNGNILVAIVSFILVRQFFSVMTGSVRDIVTLTRQRALIDALVFPDRPFGPVEARDHRTLRELFARYERERLAAAELSGLARPGQELSIRWRDPAIAGTAEFDIWLQGGDAPARHFRKRAFPPRLRHMAENEDLLFSHIDRKTVLAPPLAGRFFHGEHECLVWETGAGEPPTGKRWREFEDDFLARLWACEPPAALVKVYASSHKFLHQRLTDDFVKRMDIAVDTDEDATVLERFRAALPSVCETLAAIPLRLVNPDLRSDNVVARQDGTFHVLGWGRWAIEPGGAGRANLPAAEDRLAAILEQARTVNPAAVPTSLGPCQLLLAQHCSLLERAILRGEMKRSLSTAATLLSSYRV